MRFARAVPLLLLALVGAPAASAADGKLGQTVTVKSVVPTGDNSFRPAFYVDWLGGACPGTVETARTKAKGNTTRGLGFAEETGGGTTSVPVSAKVLLEQPSQRVCFYGGGGALATQQTLTAKVVIPPLDLGEPVEQPWTMGAADRIKIDGVVHEDPLGWAVLIPFNGRHATRFAHVTCNRKRLDMIPSRVHLTATTISYSGALRPDNSKNYDAPIPIAYNGHASFRFRASVKVGRAPLEFPITSSTGQVSKQAAAGRLGQWGVPIFRIDARFSAPGFHPFAGKPSCPSHLTAIMGAGVNAPVMPGQGDDWLNGSPDDGAGVKHNFPNTPPYATFSTDGQPHSISDGSGTVHFSSQSVDDDDGIASEQWNFGDGTTGSGREVDHTYTAPGTYDVVLTVTDMHGLTNSYTAQAYVDP
jgi:hypothetical protein